MRFRPLPLTFAVIMAAGFLFPAGAQEKSLIERNREVSKLAKQERVAADLETLQFGLRTFKLRGGQFPTAEQGLDTLVKKPEAEPVPKRWEQVMKALPLDPWSRSYRYGVRERDGKTEHVLSCDGPDLADKSDDTEFILPEREPDLEEAELEKVRMGLRHLASSLKMYRAYSDTLPTAEQGLAALSAKPALEPVPKNWMRVKKELRPDPWGRPYRYTVRELGGEAKHVLSSDGPDPADKADDVELVFEDLGKGKGAAQ